LLTVLMASFVDWFGLDIFFCLESSDCLLFLTTKYFKKNAMEIINMKEIMNGPLKGEYPTKIQITPLPYSAGESDGFAKNTDGVHFFIPISEGFIHGIFWLENYMIFIDFNSL